MNKQSELSTPLVSNSLATRAFERIENAIITGELEPGTKISEASLARRFGISRGPLREAINRLEGRKLVERITNVGARVVQLTADDLLELYLVREALEGMAARLAASHTTATDIKALEKILSAHEKDTNVQQGVAYYQKKGDLDFHFRIARCSQNTKLINLLCDDLYSVIRLYRYRFSAAPGRPQQALDEHCEILQALRAGDPDLAERAMRLHIANSRQNLMDQMKESASPSTGNRDGRER